jgi:hypothetical protein
MKKIISLIIILLIPVYAAAYTIHLKNGSFISDVRSYDETGGEVTVYFQTGSMVIPRSNILRITGEETPELPPSGETQGIEGQQGSQENTGKQPSEGQPAEGQPGIPEQREQPDGTATPTPIPTEEPKDDKSARINEVKSDLESVYADIRTLEADEAQLVKEINQKRSKPAYNKYQMNQVMMETEPLQNDLRGVQQKKEELKQRKSALENELKGLQ